MESQGSFIECSADEEHFLRRLGGALIVHWDHFSPSVQEALIQQAADMADRHPMVQVETQIREFIAHHNGGNRADRT